MRWCRGLWQLVPIPAGEVVACPMCHLLAVGTRLPRPPSLPSAATLNAASMLSLDLDEGGKQISPWQEISPLWECPSSCTQAFNTKMPCIYSDTKQKKHHWLNCKIFLTYRNTHDNIRCYRHWNVPLCNYLAFKLRTTFVTLFSPNSALKLP